MMKGISLAQQCLQTIQQWQKLHGNSIYHFFLPDTSEVLEGTHTCDQICTNTEGSFICSCNSGYNTSSDGRSCDGLFTILQFRILSAALCSRMTLSMFTLKDLGDNVAI